MRSISVIWSVVGSFLALSVGHATEERLPQSPAPHPIRVVRTVSAPSLKWTHFSPGTDQTVLLSGQLNDPEASIVMGEQKLPVGADGQFTLKVPRPSQASELMIKVVDGYGKVEEEHIQIIIRAAFAGQSEAGQGKNANAGSLEKFAVEDISVHKRFFGALSLGVSQIAYTGPGLRSTLKETALAPKFSGTYVLVPDRWDLTANLYFTEPILKSSITGATLNFLGSNVRAGYHLTSPRARWKLIFGFGIYYATTLSNQQIGYVNVSGPQVYPILQRRFSSENVFSLYVKYSPVNDSFQLLNLSNHEIAAGTSYRYKKIIGAFDFAHLKLKTAIGTAAATTFSVSLGYLF